MNPQNLTNCVDCGGVINRSASQCPHCRSISPHGTRCRLCRQIIRKPGAPILPDRVYCSGSCFETLYTIPEDIKCPDCGQIPVDLSYRPSAAPDTKFSPPRCRGCDHPNPLNAAARMCKGCNLPIFKSFQQFWLVAVPQHEHAIYHTVCAKAWNKEPAPILPATPAKRPKAWWKLW